MGKSGRKGSQTPSRLSPARTELANYVRRHGTSDQEGYTLRGPESPSLVFWLSKQLHKNESAVRQLINDMANERQLEKIRDGRAIVGLLVPHSIYAIIDGNGGAASGSGSGSSASAAPASPAGVGEIDYRRLADALLEQATAVIIRGSANEPRIQELEDGIAELQQELTRETEVKSKVEGELEDANQRVADVTATAEAKDRQLDDARRQIAASAAETQKLTTNRDELSTQVGELTDGLTAAAAEQAELQTQLTETREEKDRLTRQVDELRAALEAGAPSEEARALVERLAGHTR